MPDYKITFTASGSQPPNDCALVGSDKFSASISPAAPAGQSWNNLQLNTADTLAWVFTNSANWSTGTQSNHTASYYTVVSGIEIYHYHRRLQSPGGATAVATQALPAAFKVTTGTAIGVTDPPCVGASILLARATTPQGQLQVKNDWSGSHPYAVDMKYFIWFTSIKGTQPVKWKYDPEVDLEPGIFNPPITGKLDEVDVELAAVLEGGDEVDVELSVSVEEGDEVDMEPSSLDPPITTREGETPQALEEYEEDIARLSQKYPDVDWNEVFGRLFLALKIRLR